MFFSIYKSLCESKGMSPNKVACLLSISSGSVTAWKQGRTPNTAVLEKIADYFDVSVSYLLGYEQKELLAGFTSEQLDQYSELISILEKMPIEKREMAKNILKAMLEE